MYIIKDSDPDVESLFNWLHYKNKIKKVLNNDYYEKTLTMLNYHGTIQDIMEQLIEKCKENFLQSESATDNRPFTLKFHCKKVMNEFSLENSKSKEIFQFKKDHQSCTLRRSNKSMEKNQKGKCQTIFNKNVDFWII
ncbi:unnamed protein product [Meloidogyne enterolobii]